MEADQLQEERRLVERAKTDRAAFVELYQRYLPKIFGYVFKRCGHRPTAEDIVSQTFLKAFAALPNYQDRYCPIGAWLYRIATNGLIDHYRRVGSRREVALEQAEGLPVPTLAVGEQLDAERDRALVRTIISTLPPLDQQVIQLKFFAELSNTEIAQIMGRTVNHTGVLIYRALQRAHRAYQRYVGDA